MHGPCEKTLLDGRLRRAAFYFLVDFLEDARHADNDRGLDFAHGLRQLVELRAVRHLGAVVVHHVIENAGSDVRERQERDAGVGGVEVEVGRSEVLVGGDVAVGKGHAFGLACSAGGVDQRGQIVRLNGMRKSIEDGIALRTESIGVAEQRAHGDGAFGSGSIHHDDALKLGLVAHGEKLVELQPRGDDRDAATGVANLLGNLLAGERGIERHIGRTNGQRGKIRDQPLPAIFADECDAVTLFRAELEKGGGQCADALVDLIGRERVPLIELVLPKNRARIGGRRHAKEKVIERRDLRDRHHCLRERTILARGPCECTI